MLPFNVLCSRLIFPLSRFPPANTWAIQVGWKPPFSAPQTYLTETLNLISSNSRFLDSCSSHHIVINDLDNLSLNAPYDDIKELVIIDGYSLHISNIDSFSFYTPTKNLSFQIFCMFPPSQEIFCKSLNFVKKIIISLLNFYSFFPCQGAFKKNHPDTRTNKMWILLAKSRSSSINKFHQGHL